MRLSNHGQNSVLNSQNFEKPKNGLKRKMGSQIIDAGEPKEKVEKLNTEKYIQSNNITLLIDTTYYLAESMTAKELANFSEINKVNYEIANLVAKNKLRKIGYKNEIPPNQMNWIKLYAFTTGELSLEIAPDVIKKDRNIFLAAVSNNGLALEYASEELQADKEVVKAAA